MPKLEAKIAAKLLREDRCASIAEVELLLPADVKAKLQTAIAALADARRAALDRVASIDEDDGVLGFDYRIEGERIIVTVIQVDAP